MIRKWIALASAGLLCAPLAFARPSAKDQQDRLENAGKVMQEILNVPDDIPQDLLNKARCVIVMPSVVKAAFIVGGSYGHGVMTCRTGKAFDGKWGAPTMMALEGGSVGFQIGGQATDFVILVMNNRGVDSLLHSKVKVGADISAAAGPKGRDAEAATDVTLRSELLTYSRSRGAFAGVSLEGSTLRPDNDANKELYGEKVTAPEIVMDSKVTAPQSASSLLNELQKASPQLRASE